MTGVLVGVLHAASLAVPSVAAGWWWHEWQTRRMVGRVQAVVERGMVER